MSTFETLQNTNDLDFLLQEEFDDFALIASQICNTPISFISFLDYSRQWFKSMIGLNLDEIPVENSFCNDTIAKKEVVVIENLLLEERYSSYPGVTGDLHLRFYAGAPLITSDNVGIGTLCVLDTEVRSLSENQITALKTLSQKLVKVIELKIKGLQFEEEKLKLQAGKERLTKFAYMVSHDLKAPVNQMISLSTLVEKEIALGNNSSAQEISLLLNSRGNFLKSFINEMLEFAKRDNSQLSAILFYLIV